MNFLIWEPEGVLWEQQEPEFQALSAYPEKYHQQVMSK